MTEAKCKNCGAVYKFRGAKMPKAVRCLCESKHFANLKH